MDSDSEPRIYAFAIFIAIIIGMLAGAGAFKSQTKKRVAVNPLCQERCKYEPIKTKEENYSGSSKAEAQYIWKYYLNPNSFSERTFDSQEQCFSYCSKNK